MILVLCFALIIHRSARSTPLSSFCVVRANEPMIRNQEDLLISMIAIKMNIGSALKSNLYGDSIIISLSYHLFHCIPCKFLTFEVKQPLVFGNPRHLSSRYRHMDSIDPINRS